MPGKMEKLWPKPVVLQEIRALITMLGLEHIPSIEQIKKYTKCKNAVCKYGGVKWLSAEIGMPTAAEYKNDKGWTLEKVLAEIRRVMDLMGVHDRMPTQNEVRKYSTAYSVMARFGTAEQLAKMLGVKVSPMQKRYTSTATMRMKQSSQGPNSMEDVVQSKAFEIQRKAGRPYGQIQREQTLQMAGTIDITKYEGMKPYTERAAEHG